MCRWMLALGCLGLAALAGRAETYELTGRGSLQVFFLGDWHTKAEGVGELNISVRPVNPKIRAKASLKVSTDDREEFHTPEKMQLYLETVGRRLIETGRIPSQRIKIRQVYCRQGYGFSFTVRLGDKSADYKLITAGLVRLMPGVVVDFNLFANDEESEHYQQLLGAVEGMEMLTERKRR